MGRVNCHSAFKHYTMFHSRGGDVINIGSNNTTIFECGGGHLGGFWGGFGLGLGNAFGSLFGGGFGFGGFGFPSFGSFGMGGFGMPSYGGGWGAGNNTRTTNTATNNQPCNCNHNNAKAECNDPDRAKINGYDDNVYALENSESVQPKDVKALYDKIKKTKDSEQDGNHKDTDTVAYDNLLRRLQSIADENGWGKLDSNDFGLTKQVDPKLAKKAESSTESGKVQGGNKPSSEVSGSGPKDSAEHAYLSGYENYDGKTELKDGDVIQAIDVSGKTRATVIVSGKTSKITKASNASYPQTIVIEDQKDITYTFKEKTEQGEYVYVSDQDHQEYILQKHGDKYELVQYDWHKGYGTKDWSVND